MTNRKLSILAAAVTLGLAMGVNAQTTSAPTTPPPITTPPVTTPPDTTPPLGTQADPMNRPSTHGQTVSEAARMNRELHTPPGQIQQFSDLDRSGDGYVLRSDLQSDSEIARNFDQYDTDNDGRLSRTEYEAWVASATAPPGQRISEIARGDAPQQFSDLDTDSSGYITRADVPTGSDLARNFSTYDTNNDGRLSRAEYEAWLALQPGHRADSTLSGIDATSPTGASATTGTASTLGTTGTASTWSTDRGTTGVTGGTTASTELGSTSVDTTSSVDTTGSLTPAPRTGPTTGTAGVTGTAGTTAGTTGTDTLGATSTTAGTVGRTSTTAGTVGATSPTAGSVGTTGTTATTTGTTRTPTDISTGRMASSASPTGEQASQFGRDTARMAQQQRSFRELDSNNDGFIYRADIQTDMELATRFDEYDLDNDGRLSRTEYESWLAARDATSTRDYDTVTTLDDDEEETDFDDLDEDQ
jgi:Ca2+-binding EF-hand superfamily protein